MKGEAQTTSEIAAGIKDWLLKSPIQIGEGSERGAVAGWLEGGAFPTYAYPEITGYYLTCLSFMAATEPRLRAEASARAELALDWLERQTEGDRLPLTRVYLEAAPDDWRNRAVFSFDLGMVVRGISAAMNMKLVSQGQPVLDRYVQPLLGIARDGILQSHVARPGDAGEPLSERWSTLPGPHHVKVAAALMLLDGGRAPKAARQLAEKTADYWMNRVGVGLPRPEMHPSLYYLEGLILLGLTTGDQRYLENADITYAAIMAHQRGDGSLPACVDGTPSYVRSDVLAQALRAGAILRAIGRLPGRLWDGRLTALASLLAGHASDRGGVLFQHGKPAGADHNNTWASIFAYQAYILWRDTAERGQSGPDLFLLLA